MSSKFHLIEQVPFPTAKVVNSIIVEYHYRVLDHTKKIYDVIISNLPSCNCPASSKGLNCVHILFIFIKLLCVPLNETILFQRALLTSELITLFQKRVPIPTKIW